MSNDRCFYYFSLLRVWLFAVRVFWCVCPKSDQRECYHGGEGTAMRGREYGCTTAAALPVHDVSTWRLYRPEHVQLLTKRRYSHVVTRRFD